MFLAIFISYAFAHPADSYDSPIVENKIAESKDADNEESGTLDTENAEELGDLNSNQIRWLRPLPKRFPQNPYQHVDFTSYTLEWGEALVGLNTIKIGALPRTQLGTKPLLWLVGLNNVDAKVNLLRFRTFDIGLQGNWISLPSEDFKIEYIGAGTNMSLRILEPWSIHLGGQFASFSANGLPNLDAINPLILNISGIDVDAYRDELADQGVAFEFNTQTMMVNFATDIRLNRRDSWILQTQALVWHNASVGNNIDETSDIPAIMNLDNLFSLETEGWTPISKGYIVSLAHQWSWNKAYLRLGFGWSSFDSLPYLPAMVQSIDYAWRFGGKTKNKEGKIREGWKNNKKLIKKGSDKDK